MKEMTMIGVRGEEKAIATAVDRLGTTMTGLIVVLFAIGKTMALSKVVEVRKEIDIEKLYFILQTLFRFYSRQH